MTAMRFSGPVLPDGEVRELYVVDGRVTYERQAGAETAAEGWIVPGLVDAHCHVGLDAAGRRRRGHPGGAGDRPTATPGRCCCATAARPPTPPGSTTATTCRG